MNFLLAHLAGDYLLQNDWMAQGKKKSSFICLVHVVTYLIPFIIIGFAFWQIALIGIQHFFQDRSNFIQWWMKKVGQRNFAQPPMAPWSIIVVDNIFHLLWIGLVVWIGKIL